MDWSTAFEALGGGLPAVIIIALTITVVTLARYLVKAWEARFADQKEHTAQLIENARSLDRAIEAIKVSRDV